MWTISGPFDVEKPTSKDPTVIAQVYGTSKTKLLKTGKSYTLGRRNAELQIDWAKISKKHGLFTVGTMSTTDVENPLFRPSLTLKNLREEKKQTIGVIRDGSELTLNINMDLKLQHGDVVRAVGDIRLTICWQEVCCYSAPSRIKSTFNLDACASLGIHLVRSQHESITHYMTSAFFLDAPSAMGLLSGQKFVQLGWLTELLRLGELQPSEPQSLEWVCQVPKETKFRPTFHVSLPPEVKKFDLWLPNKERANVLQGINFVLVSKESASDMQEAIIKGGGTAETMDYDIGKEERWNMMRAASKKGKRGVVFVASEGESKKALGQDTWSDFVKDASSSGHKFCDPSLVVQAVVQMNTDNLLALSKETAGSHSISSPPEGAPNTYANEPSYPPDEDSQSKRPARKLIRRARDSTPDAAGASTSEVPASAATPEEDAPPPRRKLVRRAKQAPIIGIDDPSIVEDDPPLETTTEAPAMPPPPQVPPTTRTSRLKRRAGTNLTTVARSPSPPPEAASSTQPKLKKFKALFEESDPDRLAQSQLEEGSGAVIDTQMMQSLGFDQSALRVGTGSTFGVNTMVTNGTSGSFTQDETQAPAQASGGGSGRTQSSGSGRISGMSVLQEEEEVQEIIDPVSNESHSAGTSSPRKPSGNTPRPEEAEEIVPQSPRKKGGAEPGKPDTDVAFLKALATKKTGGKKGGEDTFDREFNNLRISKPELERETKSERQEDEWRMLADFGDDTNVRGNFMVVIPMDVPERDTNIRRRRNDTRPEWEGKADFKKFRRKVVSERRSPVTLILSGPPDGGMGPAYWPKVTHTEFQSQLDEANLPSKQESSPPNSPPKPRSRAKKREYTEVLDGSDEESSEPVVKSRRTTRQPSVQPSRVGSAVPRATSKHPPARTTRSRGGETQKTPLFIESDDDESNGKDEDFQMQEDETEDFADQIAAVPEDYEDDDDDEALPPRKGRFQTEARLQTAKAPASKKPTKKPAAPVINDDSDDGVAFKGFGSRTQTRRR